MNTIGIDNNLDRARIKKLLTIGLVASIITGVGDFLLGYGENTASDGLALVLANAPNLSDAQLVWGGLLGFVGIFLEGLSFFAIYRLMADRAPGYAHAYRAGIFGYIWLAPIGTHMNLGIFGMTYKYLLPDNPALASQLANRLLYCFAMPVWWLLIVFWLILICTQFRAFSKGFTPYPRSARWFNLIVGGLPILVVSMLIGQDTALGSALGTMAISFGNALTFGGLLATLPSERRFEEFRAQA